MSSGLARLGQAGLVSLLVAGGVAVPGAASAAAKACSLGTWTVSKHTFAVSGGGIAMKGSGGKGTKLTIKAKSVKYDFTKSARLTATGTGPDGAEFASWAKYTKTVTIGGAFKGKRGGTFALKHKTAAGGSQVLGGDIGSDMVKECYNLAKSLRGGAFEPIIPLGGKYTCAKKSLHQWYTVKNDNGSIKIDVWFKR